MEPIKAAIFDFDGTLADSMYVWEKVDRDFLTRRGIPVTKEYTDKMRSMFFETAAAYTKEAYGLRESVEEIMNVWLEMAHNEYSLNVTFKPFAKEYIEKLRSEGVRIGMATSNNPYLLMPCLEQNGVSGMFDAICYTSEVGVNKSNPDIYLYTAERLGAAPVECVVFEDIIEGLKSASSVGMRTVAVYDPSNDDYWEEIIRTADKWVLSYESLM